MASHPFPRITLARLALLPLLLFGMTGLSASQRRLGQPAPAVAEWGLLANAGFAQQPMKGVYFFAGSARQERFRDPANQPITDNMQLYTLNPSDEGHLRWEQSAAYRDMAVQMIADSGANVVLLSVWGEAESDRWRFWAPMASNPAANDQLFSAAATRDLLVIPAIESSDGTLGCNGSTPAYHFAADFPGSAEMPAPQLTNQVSALVERYLIHAQDPAWPQQWAQISDRTGEPRYAVYLLHVASRQLAPHEHERFAAGFDDVAEAVFQRTGVRVGFLLDLLPLPRVGFGELCAVEAPLPYIDTYIAHPEQSGPYLRRQRSILGVQGFIPEIYLHSSAENELLQFKQRYMRRWIVQGLPVILDASPGYDAQRVFAGSPRYGHTDTWRSGVAALYDLGCRGVAFNTWNGYTEGYSAVPTREYGDTAYHWLRSLFRRADAIHNQSETDVTPASSDH